MNICDYHIGEKEIIGISPFYKQSSTSAGLERTNFSFFIYTRGCSIEIKSEAISALDYGESRNKKIKSLDEFRKQYNEVREKIISNISESSQ